jgi:SAM-dependent methyltransferase
VTNRRWHPSRLSTRLEVRAPFLHRVSLRFLRPRFDALAPRWDAIRGDYADSRRLLDAALDALAIAPARILDVGTGTGQAALHLGGRFPAATVEGVDASPAMIEIARAKPEAAAISFAVGDGGALPYPDGAFDLAVSLLVQPFPHEVRRVLAPGGWALFCYPLGPGTPIWFPSSQLMPLLHRAGFAEVIAGTLGPGEWTAARAGHPPGS